MSGQPLAGVHRRWCISASLFVLAMIPSTIHAQSSPTGVVNVVDNAACQVSGWAVDFDAVNQPVTIRFLLDGPSPIGQLLGTVTANALRSDLPFANQNHAFTYQGTGPLSDGREHTIYVYAADLTGDPDTLLTPAGRTIRCASTTISVTDYGARGDGVTDAAAAIQAAIDAAPAGGTVMLPSGTFLLSSAHGTPGSTSAPAGCSASAGVQIPSALALNKTGVTLIGAGSSTVLKLAPDVKLRMLEVNGAGDVVTGMVFDGNGPQRQRTDGASGQPLLYPCGLVTDALIVSHVPPSGSFTVRDAEIRNGLETAILSLSSDDVTLDRVYAHDNGFAPNGLATGFALSSANGRITNNTLLRNTTGLSITARSQGVTVDNNVVSGNRQSGLIFLGPGVQAANNYLESNGGGVPAPAIDLFSSTRLASNVAVNNYSDGVRLLGSGAQIEGNYIGNTVRPFRQQVGVRIGAQGETLRSNSIVNNGGSLNDQVVLGDAAGLNPDWPSINTLTYLPPDTSGAAPRITPAGIVNAASGAGSAIAPGEIVTLYGTGLGPSALTTAQLTPTGFFPRMVAGTRVLFDSVPAPVLYTSSGQVSVVVPYFEYWHTSAQVQVEYNGQVSDPVTIPIGGSIPGIFTANSSGSGQGAILNQDGGLNSAANPAARGSIIVLYATGEGQTDPAGVDARVSSTELPKPRLPVSVTIGGQQAEVLYAGAAPGLISGAMQVNVRIPAGIDAGAAVPIQMSHSLWFDTISSNIVTVALR